VALPSGTVTFMFTDVEGSTRLLHELGAEEYAAALAKHRRSLRAVFAEHGGVEVDTQGDAFFVAFATAPEALAAAAGARAALEGGPIRVRIGLHTGTPLLTGEGYVGLDVHRAARIAAAAHGGQVVLSAATAAHAGTRPVRDLGEHRFKDLTAPERVFQLGDGEFPRLRSLHATNLPVPASPFVGRSAELGEVAALLAREDVRLVTVTGPGGAGKTRFGIQAAAEAAEAFPDGVWWVPLAPLADAAQVAGAVASGLGGEGDPAALVGERRLLLVLDNFEHVIGAAAELSRLLERCPRAVLLVTSRERLALGGEHEYELPPLARADAVELFFQRARALRPDVAANGEVGKLCERLDDLPLAIELVAARVKLFSPRQLVERLGGRLDLSGGRDADPRQRTLRAAIAWSHDLLDPGEGSLFARLSVFAGGSTLEAAEAVCDADADVLSSLVDKSLVRARVEEDGPRFWQLETIREFARERLEESGDADTSRRRHAEHYAALAERVDHPLNVEGRWETLQREVHNLRAALAWAVAAGDSELVLRLAFAGRLLWRDSFDRLRATVEAHLGRGAPPAVEAGAHYVLAWAAYRLGDLAAVADSVEQGLELARRAGGAPRLVGFLLNARANVEVDARRFDEARAVLARAAEMFEQVGDGRALAVTLANLSDVELQSGGYDEAARLAHDAVAMFGAFGDVDGATTAAVNEAIAQLYLGRLDAAETCAREALERAAAIEDGYAVACTFLVLAGVAAERGDGHRAGVLLAACVVAHESAGTVFEPNERTLHERVVARAGEVDPGGLAAGQEAGRSLSVAAAADIAAGRAPDRPG
jgi:predicted ATPase/class 3 adenylate cyclase